MSTPEIRPSFTYEVDDRDDVVFCIKVSGELRRGKTLSELGWKQILSKVLTISKTKAIIFDLTDLTYWDTEGTESIVGTVALINSEKPKRAGIVAPKDPHMLTLAKNRPVNPVETDTVPWHKSREDLIKFFES